MNLKDIYAKPPHAWSDEEAKLVGMGLESELEDSGNGDLVDMIGSDPVKIRRHQERAVAERTLNDFLQNEPTELSKDERERVVDSVVLTNRRHHQRDEARSKISHADLAELFIDDPERASALWDKLYGET